MFRSGFVVTLIIFFVGFHGVSYSVEISVVGSFKNQAVVRVNNQLQTLSVGASHPSGLRLIAVDGEGALIEIQGQKRRYPVSRDFSGGYRKRETAQAVISLNERGQYLSSGSINGRPVDLLLDTGATAVALSSNHAKALGIDYKWTGQPSLVITAQGRAQAWRVELNKVKIGDIELGSVPAVVIEGAYPVHVLLGMSFLSHVKMSENQGVVTLLQKF